MRSRKKKSAYQKQLRSVKCTGRVFIFTDHNSKEFCKKSIEILKLNGCEFYSIFNVSEDPSLLNVLGSKESEMPQQFLDFRFPQFFLNEVHLGGISELLTLHENGYLSELIRETSTIDEDEKKELFAAYFQKKRLISINPDLVIFQVSIEKRRTINVVVLTNCSDLYVVYRIQRKMFNTSVSVSKDARFSVEPNIGVIEPKPKTGTIQKLKSCTNGMVMIVVSLKSKSKRSGIQNQLFPEEEFIVESRHVDYEDFEELMDMKSDERSDEIESLLEVGKSNFYESFKVVFQEESIRD